MAPRLKIERLELVKQNKRGETMKIVEYHNANNLIVEFQDEFHGQIKSTWESWERGSIINPNQDKTGILFHPSNFKDISGQIFHNLKVLNWDTNPPDTETIPSEAKGLWKCECLLCGNSSWASSNQLKQGLRKACRECALKNKYRRKKFNEYDLSGEYGTGYTCNTHNPFYFDLEDYDLIKDYTWSEMPNGFITASKNGKQIALHRLILGVKDCNIVVDHIAHQRNDNRKVNLRATTTHNNTINDKVAKNNKSGTTGVCWNKQVHKWQAYIWHNGKGQGLGYYDNLDDAIAARHKAEDELFGEFSYRRSMESAISL